MTAYAFVAIVVLMLVANPALAAEPDCGKGAWSDDAQWKPGLVTTGILPACSMKWTCEIKQNYMHDAACKIVTTEPVTVTGKCTAGIAKCDCVTPKPSTRCQWRLQKK